MQKNKIMLGKEYFFNWKITHYIPLTYDNLGSPCGGEARVVNQKTFGAVYFFNDRVLRTPKWYTNNVKGLFISDKKLDIAIEKAIYATILQKTSDESHFTKVQEKRPNKLGVGLLEELYGTDATTIFICGSSPKSRNRELTGEEASVYLQMLGNYKAISDILHPKKY